MSTNAMVSKGISILAIGNELLSGDIADKNAAYLARELSLLGIPVVSISMCGDSLQSISDELARLSKYSKVVITSGGLGPTSDDITRNAVASLLGQELVENKESRVRLESYAKSRGRKLTNNSLQQVMFPAEAEIIENTYGTADCFISEISQDCWIVSLPGVPKEVQGVFEDAVKSKLSSIFPENKARSIKILKLFGLSESYVGSQIDALELEKTYGESIEIAYRPSFPELTLMLSSKVEEVEILDEASQAIVSAIGDEFFHSVGHRRSLCESLSALLHEKSMTVSVAESCSGGLFSSQMVNLPGSSNIFKGSVVAYSNRAKMDLLAVRQETLESLDSSLEVEHGAVSEQCAIEMACGALKKFSSTYAVSITGVAGPEGGTEKKPVGRVCIAVCTQDSSKSFTFNFPTWSREFIRLYSVAMAMDIVRRTILNKPTTWEKR